MRRNFSEVLFSGRQAAKLSPLNRVHGIRVRYAGPTFMICSGQLPVQWMENGAQLGSDDMRGVYCRNVSLNRVLCNFDS